MTNEKVCFETLQDVYALLTGARRSLKHLSGDAALSILKMKADMAIQAIEESGLGIHLRHKDLN